MSSITEGSDHRPTEQDLQNLARTHLEMALHEGELMEKHYRIRSALQYMVIFEEEFQE